MSSEVTVLGGGIIGLSCAIALDASGVKVNLISENFCWEESSDPAFASKYPAASIIAHSVEGDTSNLYAESYELYVRLIDKLGTTIRKQKHVEIHENNKVPYTGYLVDMNAVQIQDYSIWGLDVPIRNRGADLSGYGFEIIFVEIPKYIDSLKKYILRSGITVSKRRFNEFDFSSCENSTIINCLGLNGGKFVSDESKMNAIAGILLSLSTDELLMNSKIKSPISYNYNFENLEVYSYPREKDVLFGGTRIKVNPNLDLIKQLREYFEAQDIDYLLIDNFPVPSYIVNINIDFYKQLYNVDLSKKISSMKVLFGLRPVRDLGIRIDSVQEFEKNIINAYGFGGAGVTLAWGTATEVVRIFNQIHEKGDVDARQLSDTIVNNF